AREALVAFQFAVGIGLGIASAVVHLQVQHMRTAETGYDREGLVVLAGLHRPDARRAWEALRTELAADPRILGVTASYTVPGEVGEAVTAVQIAGRPDAGRLDVALHLVDDAFAETYRIRLLAGRGLSAARDGAGASALLTAGAARGLGFATPDEAVGATVETVADERALYTVVGIMDDVRFRSAREAPMPGLVVLAPERTAFATVRVGADVPGALAHIDAAWRRLVPDTPVRRSFLADTLDALYGAEARQAGVLTAFTLLAAAIACLGLLGMSSLAARRRTREMALRKVLGAGGRDIAWLLLREGARPVLLGAAVACPAAWAAMRWWLEGFADRIALGPALFLAALAAALAIAGATLAVHGARVAAARPADALRTD
ncbi:MAG TPA: FtsX-like permease family protein, partial [Azospirillaceae bacterium]|nr:FtsX-like permease family protein [Azospirillaceae bacterium]